MTLETGSYIIRSKLNDHEVGRYPIEDRSLLPKPLFVLQDQLLEPKILVNKVDKGYIILAAGNGTAPFKGSVYAILLDKPEPEAWVITEQPQHGKNVYTIETNDQRAGWVVETNESDDRGNRINVRPLIIMPSYPPRFPPTELFEFIRVDDD